MKLKGQMGGAYVFFVVLVLLFTIILLYNVFSPAIVQLDSAGRDFINDTNTSLSTSALNTMDIIGNVWTYWPFFIILFLVLFMLVAGQKKEPYYG